MAGVQQLLDCMISRWYPNFQRATFKTVILPLPQPVLDWLVSDGLHLPDDSEAVRTPIDGNAAVAWARLSLLPLPPPLPLCHSWFRQNPNTPPRCPQFAKRGPMDEHALDDEYREWSDGEEGEAGSDAGSAAPQVGPRRSCWASCWQPLGKLLAAAGSLPGLHAHSAALPKALAPATLFLCACTYSPPLLTAAAAMPMVVASPCADASAAAAC